MDLIIGAGVTGLSYAMFTSNDYLILEKSSEYGGYCKTTKRNGFVWDYSGHFFHFQDEEIRNKVFSKMNKDDIVDVIKETRIKYKDLLVDYPFQKNIHQLPKEELIDCLYDLFADREEVCGNFQEMLYSKFGKSIAEKFLIPYNEKLYACDLNTLDKDAMGRFFPHANKTEIIRNFRNSDNASYNNSFIYPKEGAIEYIKSIVEYIDSDKILYNSEVVKIKAKEHVAILGDGTEIKYDRLISTMPFPELLDKVGIEYDADIYAWNQVLCFNLGFAKKGVDEKNHWLYFPEKKYCFYRVGFYDNIIGQNQMSLYVELGFDRNAKVEPSEWLGRVLKDLRDAGIVSEDNYLMDYQSLVMDPAYVHVNSKSTTDVENKKAYLKEYDIYSLGRYGSWIYCSIEDNMKEARDLVQSIKIANE